METHNIGRLWRAALVVLAANVVGVTALWAKYAVNVHFPGERRGGFSRTRLRS